VVETIKFIFTEAVQVYVFESQIQKGNPLLKPRPIYVKVHCLLPSLAYIFKNQDEIF